jgi:hypothetical protein
MNNNILTILILVVCIVSCKRDNAKIQNTDGNVKSKNQSTETNTLKHDTTMGVMLMPAQNGKPVSFSKPAPYSGYINIVMLSEGRVYPPCEMLLVDPLNRKLGYNAEKKDRLAYKEIPDAFLENMGETDGENGSFQIRWGIEVAHPTVGVYHLRIVGTDTGMYLVQFICSDIGYNSSDSTFSNIKIKPGGTQNYQFHYDNKTGYKAKFEQVSDK